MKKFTLILLAAVTLLPAAVSVAQQTENRAVSLTGTYESISVGGSPSVHFRTGPAGDPVTVNGVAEDLNNLEIRVRNNTLHIGFRKGYNRQGNRPRVEVYVQNPVLKNVTISGSGRLNVESDFTGTRNNFKVSGSGQVNIAGLTTQELEMTVSGSGHINIATVHSPQIKTTVSGSGRIELPGVTSAEVRAKVSGSGRTILAGRTDTAELIVSGSGRITAESLTVTDAEVKVSGSGNVSVRCTGQLDASSGGSGKVYYHGEPAQARFNGRANRFVQR
ncbi:MAG: DUF2807 domain-containing protein [Rikenellaceae bacterium]|nr:DUF2807 domain-containing protein [Rikenellaceae bacterium]